MEAVIKSSIWGNIVMEEQFKRSIWGNIVMEAVKGSMYG